MTASGGGLVATRRAMKAFQSALCAQGQWILKMAIVILFTGLTFRFFYQSVSFDPNFSYPTRDYAKQSDSQPPTATFPDSSSDSAAVHSHLNNVTISSSEQMATPSGKDLEAPMMVTPPPPFPPANNDLKVPQMATSTVPPQVDAGISPRNESGSNPPHFEIESEVDLHDETYGVPPPPIDDAGGVNFQNGEEKDTGECDIFVGDWIPSSSGPTYTNATCPVIESGQNCMRNGRPDTDYLHWKWSPRNCELPPFEPQAFLEFMKGKTFAVIGDSIARNHAQSLLCSLSSAEQPVEVYHDENYKTKRWIFPSYNFTLWNIWSPFLLQASIFEDDNGVASSIALLHFDRLDKGWADIFLTLDYIVISSGQWFLKSAIYHENGREVGCHNCDQSKNLTETGFAYAYQKAIHMVLDFVASSNHTGTTFFRMSLPDHFENGDWHTGGDCPKKAPVKSGEIVINDVQHYLRDVEVEEFRNASAKATANGVDLKLLDFTNVLLTRPDGHPSAYRDFHPFADGKKASVRDCLHWCLPGPIDYLNHIIMKLIVG